MPRPPGAAPMKPPSPWSPCARQWSPTRWKPGGSKWPIDGHESVRVIWVTPSLPHPHGTGGCVHEFSRISALAARHEIHVITSDPQGQLDSAVLDDIAASFTRVPWTQFPYPATRFG